MKIAIASLVATALSVATALPALADGNRGYDQVTKVQIGADGHVYFNVAGNFTWDHGCRERWWGKSQYSINDARTKALLDIALTSLTTARPVWVYTQGCTAAGIEGYPIVVQLQVQNPGA